MSSLPVRAGSGAIAGLGATFPMSLVMLAAKGLGLMRAPQPPEQITRRAAHEVAGSAPHVPTKAAAVIAHLAFGAAAGAGFSMLAGRRAESLPLGATFGMAVWVASYCGWIPALDLMPRPTRDDPGRAATMIAAHVTYGTALALLLRPLDRWLVAGQDGRTP